MLRLMNLANLMGIATPSTGVGEIIRILGSDLLGYFDAERKSDLTVSDGKVAAWRDSITGISLTQATAAAQPTYSAANFNGRPSGGTDGIDDFLNFTPGVPYPLGADEGEIWLLGSQKTPASNTSVTSIFGYGNSNAGAGRIFSRLGVSGANRIRMSVGSAGATVVLQASATDATGPVLIRGTCLADVARLEVNGLVEAEQEITLGGTATTRVRAGANLATTAAGFNAFDFNKILITRPLSAEKANRLRSYLAALGGVTLAVPFSETIDPAKWAPVTADPYSYNSVTYHNDSALKPWSICRSLIDPDLWRMEVREGDRAETDEGKATKYNRAELGSFIRPEGTTSASDYIPYGQEEGHSLAAKFRNLAAAGSRNFYQLFNDDVEMQLACTPTSIVLRSYHYENGSRVTVERYVGPPLVEDAPENFLIKALRIPSGGELSLWRGNVNGGALTQVFSVTGIPFGTAAAQKRHKFGPYRVETPPPSVCEIFKPRFGAWADFSSKIANPDPWPTPWLS